MQIGSFSPLFLPRASKIRSRACLRALDLISLKGGNEKLPSSHTYFIGHWTEKNACLVNGAHRERGSVLFLHAFTWRAQLFSDCGKNACSRTSRHCRAKTISRARHERENVLFVHAFTSRVGCSVYLTDCVLLLSLWFADADGKIQTTRAFMNEGVYYLCTYLLREHLLDAGGA